MANNIEKQLKEISERLEQGVKEIFTSERYTEYLNTMSKFHNYSFNNTLLITMQKPEATLVAGYQAWQKKFNRHVKRGEKGIQIIAPAPIREKQEIEKIDPVTKEPVIGDDGQPETEIVEMVIPRFRVTTVFDVSQTEGRELPSLGVESLTGTVEGYEKLLSTLKSISPVPVSEGPLPPGVHGAYYHAEQKITLSPGMSEAQTIKTLVHEIAHAKLHALPVEGGIIVGAHEKDRRTREVEAESVAYTVCQYLGLDTSDYSFGYITGWSSGREQKELRASLECIRNTAAELIDGVESRCLDRPPPEPVPQSQKRRTKGRKKRARTSKVPSI